MWQIIQKFGARIKGRTPIVYSLVIIALIPLFLVLNTLWNLRAYERDMHFAVREKVLFIQQMSGVLFQNSELTNEALNPILDQIRQDMPAVISMSVLTRSGATEDFQVVATTRLDAIETDEKMLVNMLAWTEERSFFTQIYDPILQNSVWSVVAPIYGQDGHKIGLVNIKVSTDQVDAVVARTTRDALIILLATVGIAILLLLNHAKFYERSLLYEKLKEVDRMKDDFISVASHELRTPLTAIKGYAEMVERDLGEQISANTRKYMYVIKQSIQRLDNLVEDLLNVSRIEQNRLDFNLSGVNSATVIAEVLEQLLPNAQAKGLELINHATDASIIVLSQPDRLREVLFNLIGNAIKYTIDGQVEVSQETKSDLVNIYVKDSGIGISPQDKARLFQKFSRLRNEKTQDVPGTGLGLWITKEIVEKMHGKIYVDSVLDQGTVFTVTLQRA